MTEKEFYREFGNIDPKMIEAAEPAEKVQRKKRNTWGMWASIAACLCLVVTVGVIGSFRNDPTDIHGTDFPGYVAKMSFYYEGDVCNGKEGTITHKGFDESSITLYIEKTSDTPITLYFRGLNDGEYEAIFSNNEDLIFIVNGVVTDQLPTAAGKYEVKIDYSKFKSKCDKMDIRLNIKDYGYFSLNGEGWKIADFGDFSDLETVPDERIVFPNSCPWLY